MGPTGSFFTPSILTTRKIVETISRQYLDRRCQIIGKDRLRSASRQRNRSRSTATLRLGFLCKTDMRIQWYRRSRQPEERAVTSDKTNTFSTKVASVDEGPNASASTDPRCESLGRVQEFRNQTSCNTNPSTKRFQMTAIAGCIIHRIGLGSNGSIAPNWPNRSRLLDWPLWCLLDNSVSCWRSWSISQII